MSMILGKTLYSEYNLEDFGPQKQDVLKHLNEHGKIRSLEAIKQYGITRLSAVIYDLRHYYGINIHAKMIPVKNRRGRTVMVAEYSV